jgi:dipeptidase E
MLKASNNFINLNSISKQMTKAIIASTSTLHGGDYLEYLFPVLKSHFEGCQSVLFIPYARPGGISHDDYTQKVKIAFAKINIDVTGIHEYPNAGEVILGAEALFVGGGNTFLLVSQLYENNIMTLLSEVIKSGKPYLGTSAGSNITGFSMQTTNDMPIIYPPSFETLGIIPFNLNPHYLDPDPSSNHMGETRETRIKEFHAFNETPVLGLREGSWLEVLGEKIILKGNLSARLFQKNKTPEELATGSDLSYL